MSNNEALQMIKNSIRTIPNFPKEGIMFRDVTTLLSNAEAFQATIRILKERYQGKKIDKIVGIESRGFVLGAALAYALNIGFVPVRKKGKLPGKKISRSYNLEYGTDTLEIHVDALNKGEQVVLVDDLLATGGTGECGYHLVKELGGNVLEFCCVIDLPELKGSEKLKAMGLNVYTMIDFEGH
jgi:adenine phosphoribosyltransferase